MVDSSSVGDDMVVSVVVPHIESHRYWSAAWRVVLLSELH